MDTTDRVFGPMRPEAEEEALLLAGHRVIGGDVLSVMRALPLSDVNILITFSQIAALSMDHMPQRYTIDLVLGYHSRDPERHATEAQNIVLEELNKAKRYYQLMAEMPKFPELYYMHTADTDEHGGDAELVWGLSERPREAEYRNLQANCMLRNLTNIQTAVTDKAAFDTSLGDELKQMHRFTYL